MIAARNTGNQNEIVRPQNQRCRAADPTRRRNTTATHPRRNPRLTKVKTMKKTAIAIGVAQLALMTSGIALAQTEPTQVVVHAQRAALESGQAIKKIWEAIIYTGMYGNIKV